MYAVAFFVALAVSAYTTTFFLVKGQPEIEAPDLIGKDAVTALKVLSDIGLNLKVRAIDFNDEVPKDHIISQDPAPGSKLKKKREIKVVLSKGSASAPLPDLRGLTQGQASSILKQSRLKAGEFSYTYGSGPEQGRDRVIAQYPEAPARIKPGGKVDLLISLGPRPQYMVMPDLTGRPYSVALLVLEKTGLELGRLETKSLANWPLEAVVVQDPAAGGRIAKGSMVRLTVNRKGAPEHEDYSFRLMEYKSPYGLLRREIKFRAAVGQYLIELHNDWHGPGATVKVIALVKGKPRGHVLEDGEEVADLGKTDIITGAIK